MAPSKQRSGGNARPLESWTRAWFVGETRRPMTRPDPGTNTSTSSGKQPAPGRRRNAGERCAGAGGTTPRGVVSGGGPRSRLAAALDSRRPLHRPREVCRRHGSSSPDPARTRRPARASLSPPPRGGGRPAARRAAGLPRGRLPSAPQGRDGSAARRKGVIARWPVGASGPGAVGLPSPPVCRCGAAARRPSLAQAGSGRAVRCGQGSPSPVHSPMASASRGTAFGSHRTPMAMERMHAPRGPPRGSTRLQSRLGLGHAVTTRDDGREAPGREAQESNGHGAPATEVHRNGCSYGARP